MTKRKYPITVIIDRNDKSNIARAKAAIEQVREALLPMRRNGLRVRVTVSSLSLKEDKRWN